MVHVPEQPRQQPGQNARRPVGRRWVARPLIGRSMTVMFMLIECIFGLAACGVSTTGGLDTSATTSATSTGSVTTEPFAPLAQPCPQPAHASTGAQLYWEYSDTHSQGRVEAPVALCGTGFRANERVTVDIETADGKVQGNTLGTVTANSDGAFAASYAPTAGCPGSGSALVVRAHGDQGSNATVALPPGLPTGCAPA